jgi:hypothetical protein
MTLATSGTACFNTLDDLIDEALSEAAGRGIEVIDLPFMFKESWISHYSYWNATRRISRKWMERVDNVVTVVYK